MLRLCFPWEQRVQDISVWREVQRDTGLPEPAASQRRQREFRWAHAGLRSWLGACLQNASSLCDPSAHRKATGVPCRAVLYHHDGFPCATGMRVRLLAETENEPGRV